MNKQSLDRQWNFMPAVTSNNWWLIRESTPVDLPHDFSIMQKRDPHTFAGASNGFFPGGAASYEKILFIPEEWKGRKVILEFEGVYMNATVRFNHQIITRHPYGYTSFHCDLTSYLAYGRDNIINVTVNNGALPNTRWYSGSGIYRHVWLLAGGDVHIPPWGVYATASEISPEISTVLVKTKIENNSTVQADVIVRTRLMTASGCEAAAREAQLQIASGTAIEAQQTLIVSPANLWSVENPYLYTLQSEIVKDGIVIDSNETQIGIRSISFNAQKGFVLNGLPMKLKGGCVHHDCGLLGAAAYNRAEVRKVELLKASGYNAVRCAHNPPSPAFLDACDRLGMLVIDEAFDCWREEKTPNDYGACFEEWWQRDITSMVLRDRNHPCIILWSTGNEIPERDGRSNGYYYARQLADLVRSLDNTRGITNALNGIGQDPLVAGIIANMDTVPEDYDYWREMTLKFVEPLDVVGYNYLLDFYESDGEKFPNRVICGTETFPKQAYDYWVTTERLPHVIGDFVWTSLDYLGEAGLGHISYNVEKYFLGNYPWHQANCGDIDICGFKRPQSYYRDCVWGISKSPYIAVNKPEHYGKTPDLSLWAWADVAASWTWPGYEGKPVIIDVYCSDMEVELFLNERSLGRKPAGKPNRYTASFETVYEPGDLVAVGLENGTEVSRTALATAGVPAAIRLTPDRTLLNAEFGDLAYVTVELLDNKGNLVHNASNNIFLTVSGVGSLLAVGSSNPTTEESYTGNQRRVFEGRSMVVIRTSGETGKLVMTASSEGITTAETSILVG